MAFISSAFCWTLCGVFLGINEHGCETTKERSVRKSMYQTELILTWSLRQGGRQIERLLRLSFGVPWLRSDDSNTCNVGEEDSDGLMMAKLLVCSEQVAILAAVR
jgi:hypothetical protein